MTHITPVSDPFLARYWQVKKKCPKCEYQWSDDISSTMFNLRKVFNSQSTLCWILLILRRWTSSGSTGTRKVLNGWSNSSHSWRLNKPNMVVQ